MDGAVFQICRGKNAGKRFTLPIGSFSIGRATTCHLRVASDDVSRLHCELQIVPNGVVVKNLHSRNGTYLNGSRILEPVMIREGDHVRVGPLEFELVSLQVGLKKQGPETAPQHRPVDLNKMTLDEFVRFDEEQIEPALEVPLRNPEPIQKEPDIGSFTTTISVPGPLAPNPSPAPTGTGSSDTVDTTQAAKIALRKIFRGGK